MEALEQIPVALIQSLLSVPEGPPAQGTVCKTALHPDEVTLPSDLNLKVKQPLE